MKQCWKLTWSWCRKVRDSWAVSCEEREKRERGKEERERGRGRALTTRSKSSEPSRQTTGPQRRSKSASPTLNSQPSTANPSPLPIVTFVELQGCLAHQNPPPPVEAPGSKPEQEQRIKKQADYEEGRRKATKLSWREAGPSNHHHDNVDPNQ